MEKDKLDQLLHTSKETQHSGYNYFKEVPKSPSITHMKDLQNRLSFIKSFLRWRQLLLKSLMVFDS